MLLYNSLVVNEAGYVQNAKHLNHGGVCLNCSKIFGDASDTILQN